MFKALIFHSVDLINSSKNYVSISGGKATHRFYLLNEMTDSDLNNLMINVRKQYGTSYDSHENIDYLVVEECDWVEVDCHEHYEIHYYNVSETPVILS
jgi:hypothetical protein